MNWKGRRAVWGLWFQPSSATPQRLAHHWTEGARLFEASDGWLLVFSQPIVLEIETLSVVPLVEVQGGWCSSPSVKSKEGEVSIRWQGQTWSASPTNLKTVELSTLWDGTTLSYQEGSPLQQPLGRPEISTALPLNENQIRELLKDLPEASPESKEWQQRLKNRTSSNQPVGFFARLTDFFHSRSNQLYLEKMLRLFETEQWSDALRYAIPLSHDTVNLASFQDALQKLKPRKSLQFTTKSVSDTGIPTSAQGLDLIHDVYSRAFQSLEEAGEIHDAAFVKAELLDDPEGAVELLERHEMFETAARLAMVKGLPAARQVHLLFRAGQIQEALLVARIHGAHATALYTLEQICVQAGDDFRILWSEELAKSGHIAKAAIVGWSVRDGLTDYKKWLEQALNSEGWGSEELLANIFDDEKWCLEFEIGKRLQSWFAQADPLTLPQRRDFLQTLFSQPVTSNDPEVRLWAGQTARQLMRQNNGPWPLGDKKTLGKLAMLSGDPWLRADLPRELPTSKMHLNRWHQVVERRGQLPIFDAASAGGGRLLVALGYAGLALISSRGATSQRFSTPVHRFVEPRHSDLFLTLSGGRVGRFQGGRFESICSVEIDGFANSHDDYGWNVWYENNLYRIDIHSLLHRDEKRWTASFHATLPDPPMKLYVGSHSVGVQTQNKAYYFHSPDWKLFASQSIEKGQPFLLTSVSEKQLHWREDRLYYADTPLTVKGDLVESDFQDPFGILISKTNDGLTLCVFLPTNPALQLVLELPQATQAQVRTWNQLIVVSDNLGRLLVVDPINQTWPAKFFL